MDYVRFCLAQASFKMLILKKLIKTWNLILNVTKYCCVLDYRTIKMLGVYDVCFMLLKEVSYAHQDCIYLIKNTEK